MTSGEAGLRRADWRFLLPSPPGESFRHLVLLGGPPELGRRLVELGTAAEVSTGPSSGRPVDALVVLADAVVSFQDAARGLAPDAVLYWEIDRRGRGGLTKGPRWVHRQLREAGLRQTGAYWVIPEFGDARRYLPLDPPAAVGWFFATRFMASTPGRLALELLVSVALRWGDRVLESVVPCRAVIATAAARPFTPPVALSHGTFPVALRDAGIRPVLFTSGQDDGSRLVVLPFADAARQPELVIKTARLPGFTRHSEQEQATLVQLRAAFPADLRQTLPDPLGMAGTGSAAAFLETLIPGRMLAASTGRWRAPLERQVGDLGLAAEWLARFHEATLLWRRWDGTEIDRWVEQPLARYQDAFGLQEAERRLFAAVRRRAATLEGESLPIVWAHNDFNPWHLYRAGSDVGVIDWEFGRANLAERQGPALCDLIYFITHWIHLARGLHGEAAALRGFGELFLAGAGPDARSDAARDALATYMRRLDLHPGFLPLLLVYTWVERAVDRYHRQLALESPAPAARGENRFARYVEILAQGTTDLFREERAIP